MNAASDKLNRFLFATAKNITAKLFE